MRAELGEVSLDGWVIESPDVAAAPLVEDLHRYLQESFGRKPVVSSGSAPGRLTLRIDSAAGSVPESFKVVTEAERIEVTAPHWRGLRQAVSYLKDVIEERGAPLIPEGTVRRVRRLSPAFLYSYFALFGDPLIEDEVDPFPEGYLEKLSRLGVTGVWLQAILHNLAPSSIFPEFGEGSEKRLHTLLQLVNRAQERGLKIYLYLNEPRAMPETFFRLYPHLKGTHEPTEPGHFAMCTSQPQVRDWLRESLNHVF